MDRAAQEQRLSLPSTRPSRHGREFALSRARDLHEKRVWVDVVPMAPPGQAFDMGFWSHIQGGGAGDDEADDAQALVPAVNTSDTTWFLRARPA